MLGLICRVTLLEFSSYPIRRYKKYLQRILKLCDQGLVETMKSFFKNSFPFLLISLSFNAYALVDYSETVAEPAPAANKLSTKMQAPKAESRSLIWKSDFSLTTNYEAMEINSEKIGVLNLNTHLQTPFNVFMDLSYWRANEKSGSQNGNPKAIIGFNWLRFGSPSDEAKFDIYGGGKFAGTSELASSRTDKIFGLETTKRFGTFGLGIGYEMTLTGDPKKESDMSIGNIHRIAISGGWMVSNDIQFELEMENFKINEASNTTRVNHLNSSVTFSTISPKLNLTIVPAVNLELGARFRTNKPKSNQNLSSAKLFDLHGAYSNSLFAGINFNI